MSRGFQRPAARPCAGGGAATPGCDPAVCGAQKRRHTGKLRERNQGPGPPDTRREEDDRVGAAIVLSCHSEDAHFAKKLFLGETQQIGDAPVLKRSESKAAGHEDARHAASESDAEGAVGVEEEPARARLPLLSVISEQREIMAHKKRALARSSFTTCRESCATFRLFGRVFGHAFSRVPSTRPGACAEPLRRGRSWRARTRAWFPGAGVCRRRPGRRC